MDSKVDDACGEVHFLSPLPDDLLSHILSFLRVEAAVYAKLLSRRWRHLFPTNPTLYFSNNELSGFGSTFYSRRELMDEPQKFVAWVDTFMQRFRAPRIQAIELSKNVGGEYARSVDEWIRIACLKKVQRIAVHSDSDDSYMFPFHLLHAGGSATMEHLYLDDCSLPPLATLAATRIISLRTLHFHGFFHLNIGNLELMAFCFPNLESLTFALCPQLPDLRNLCGLWRLFLNLKSLALDYCGGEEDFEISDVKLTNFKYAGYAESISLKGLNSLLIYSHIGQEALSQISFQSFLMKPHNS